MQIGKPLELASCNIDPSTGRVFATMQKFDGKNVTSIQLNFAIVVSDDDSIKKVDRQAKGEIVEILKEALEAMRLELVNR